MKKILLFVMIFGVSIVCIAAYFSNNHNWEYNDLVMANIEALSDGESSGSMACSNSLTYTGSYNHMTMSCKTCSFRVGYTGTNDSRCQ